MSTALLVALGAAVGAPLRYLAAHHLDTPMVSHRGTLLVNVLGSLLLGWMVARAVSGEEMALLGVGFCGALTTYSSVSLQAANLGWRRGLVYAATTVLACLAAAWVGLQL